MSSQSQHFAGPAATGRESAIRLPVRASSFYLGMRILPRVQRQAMYAIYGFCRAVDDVADSDASAQAKLWELASWRAAIDHLYDADRPVATLTDLQTAIRRFALEQADFHAVIDGMITDAAAPAAPMDWAALELYCDRVASAPGRLSVRVFGIPGGAGHDLAHHLGCALQFTNILRDIDEDAALGRLYLPLEALRDAGVAAASPASVRLDPRLPDACRPVAERAREHFRQARRIMDAVPRDRVRAPRLMAAAYGALLDQLTERGWSLPRRKVSRRKRVLAGAVLRYGLF